MEITRLNEGDKIIFKISGRIDTQTSPEVQKEVDCVLSDEKINLELDLENVEYVSSAGLRTILYFQKKINEMNNSCMVIKNPNTTVTEILEMTGFTDILTII